MKRQPHKPQKKLLGIDTNYKTAKGQAYGYMTGILYLSPADLSGWNVCPQASKGCKAACLNTAGRGGMNSVQASRLNKTRWYFTDRDGFMAQLVKDIRDLMIKANREGYTPVVRLNGTSDIPWERVPLTIEGQRFANIMDAFPGVQFYDYTKITKRALAHARGEMPKNYHLTFSLTEENDRDAALVLGSNGNVAAVFTADAFGIVQDQGRAPLFGSWQPAVDADQSDLRFLDPRGVVCALKAKGKARKDNSGFVRGV
jgi:hypothetical protein